MGDLNKDIEELKDWQNEQYSPGNYIGTGKVPRPIMGLTKFPIILLIIGVLILVVGVFLLYLEKYSIGMINLILGMPFLYGGIARIRKYKRMR
ncbi:MAG: hypothetical protein WC996_06645 [Peptostreptococcales bacterium]